MTTPTKEELGKADWNRINRRKGATFSIEFTFNYGGWVRAKLDSIVDWEYLECKMAVAQSLGELIVNQQRSMGGK